MVLLAIGALGQLELQASALDRWAALRMVSLSRSARSSSSFVQYTVLSSETEIPAQREKGILEGLQKPSTFKSGTLVRKCRFYIVGKEKSRRIEYRQAERSVSRRKESGIDERDRVQERNVGEQYRS